jgi:hypothetical protein
MHSCTHTCDTAALLQTTANMLTQSRTCCPAALLPCCPADNSKSSRCEAINRACGTGANAPCCPASYERGILYNPPLAAPAGCPDGMFCESTSSTGSRCVPNSPDCGSIGKRCCVQTSRVGVYVMCGPSGFCSNPAMAAFKGAGYGPLSSLMCRACPDGKCDTDAEKRIGIQGHLDKLP